MFRQQLRTLGNLATTLNFPLTDWLRKERHRAALIKDMDSTLRDLHVQFNWPWPDQHSNITSPSSGKAANSPPMGNPAPFLSPIESHRRLSQELRQEDLKLSQLSLNDPSPEDNGNDIRRSFSSISEPGDSLYRRSGSNVPDANRRRAMTGGDVEKEIRTLLRATYRSKNFGWTLLLATLLLDLGVTLEVARECEKDSDHRVTFQKYKQMLAHCGR